MNQFLMFVVRLLVAAPAAVFIWVVSYLLFNQTFWISAGVSLLTGVIIYGSMSLYYNSHFLKSNGLTRREYQYIRKNLNEAKPKISRIQKTLLSIRHLPSLKQRIELIRIIRKISKLIKKEPKRFYKAEPFYFSHLDSAVELTEKYILLSSQPMKNKEIDKALSETRVTLAQLTDTVEQDLVEILSDDIEQLNFELDVAKKSIKKPPFLDESRRLK
ncbi:5-bromo-4-chloroindolyl phosphate hydrolysis family protein [Bacillus massiliglaciei]|uniref:5-bromo-4-chloroindolyl phosphate hydrolysis family protein n=1 Tax=Bacillus massiliglaciei TaxID=1816693 RepID=UPI000ADD7484|nr:5-bromo-4-chloroindolyl phosphate hydrolysis family protein [Bacillus massiliglaciei]